MQEKNMKRSIDMPICGQLEMHDNARQLKDEPPALSE